MNPVLRFIVKPLLIPVETLRYERDCLRKAREAHLIHKGNIMEPLGINKRDEL